MIQTWQGLTSSGHLHQWDTAFVLLLVCEDAAFDELYNIRLHPTQGARSRVPRVPALRCIVTPRGAGEPDRYTAGA